MKTKLPRRWSMWEYWTQRKRFEDEYRRRAKATIWNESETDSPYFADLCFTNKITLFGFYGIFLNANGWYWRQKRISRLRLEVEWT